MRCDSFYFRNFAPNLRKDMPKFTKIIAFLLLSSATTLAAAADESTTDLSLYKPEIHGVIRPRFEYDTSTGTNNFKIRNARLSLDGRVSDAIDYKIQVDLCNSGSFKALDFYGRFRLSKPLSLKAGQFRMPLALDPFRGPANYFFSNTSFISENMFNVRSIGVEADYDIADTDLRIEGGVFSTKGISSQATWNKGFAYSARAIYSPGQMTYTAGFGSIKPHGIRTNVASAAARWSDNRWTISAEYMYKSYADDTHDGCHGYLAYANYRFPVKIGIFNYMSVQARFDGMTDHSDANPDGAVLLTTSDPARNRITAGATITYFKTKYLFCDIRASYEKYFYHHDYVVPDGNGDRITMELVIRF